MTKAVLVLVATLAFVAGSYLVSFSGFAPDQFPVPQTDPPVQPAGYAFAIWGVIFLWLIVSALYGVLRRASDPLWDSTRAPLIVSLGVGAAWNSVANASPVWATALIWVMLVAALLALLKAPGSDRPWLAWPLGLYAGWLTAASCVALGLLAAGYGITGAVPAALGAIVAAGALALVMIRATANPAYALAVIWALIALIGKNLGAALPVAIAAGSAATLVAAIWGLTWRERGPSRVQERA
ncbi:MAG: hypothetical protein AAGM21_09900 [Pseudomonadota bacterium]